MADSKCSRCGGRMAAFSENDGDYLSCMMCGAVIEDTVISMHELAAEIAKPARGAPRMNRLGIKLDRFQSTVSEAYQSSDSMPTLQPILDLDDDPFWPDDTSARRPHHFS